MLICLCHASKRCGISDLTSHVLDIILLLENPIWLIRPSIGFCMKPRIVSYQNDLTIKIKTSRGFRWQKLKKYSQGRASGIVWFRLQVSVVKNYCNSFETKSYNNLQELESPQTPGLQHPLKSGIVLLTIEGLLWTCNLS